MKSNLETTTTLIKNILIERKIWLSVAESLTCGKLQSNLGEVSGISKCFKGGITAYTIDEKVEFLNVDKTEAEKVNCVSEVIACQMAKGVSKMFKTEIGIGTTGYAEKDENQKQHAYFAVFMKENNTQGQIIIKDRIIGGDISRKDFQIKVVTTVIDRLLNYLEN